MAHCYLMIELEPSFSQVREFCGRLIFPPFCEAFGVREMVEYLEGMRGLMWSSGSRLDLTRLYRHSLISYHFNENI